MSLNNAHFPLATTIPPRFFHSHSPNFSLLSPKTMCAVLCYAPKPKLHPFPSSCSPTMTALPPPARCRLVLRPGMPERDGWAPGGCNSPQPPRKISHRSRQAALQVPCCAAPAPPFARCGGFEQDSTSGRVLPPCRPHSGLWRPAGVWRISCTAAPPFCRADNILRGVRAPMYDVRPRCPSTRLPPVMLHSHVHGENSRGDKILAASQHPEKPLRLPGKKVTLE